jgi:hypothetical protein
MDRSGGSHRRSKSAWDTLCVRTTLTSAELAALDAGALRAVMNRVAMNNSAQRRSAEEAWSAAQQPRAVDQTVRPDTRSANNTPRAPKPRRFTSQQRSETANCTPQVEADPQAAYVPPPHRAGDAAAAESAVTEGAAGLLPFNCVDYRPADAALFAAVAAFQHLCDEYDGLHVSPPPLWPMLLRAGWCAPPIQVIIRVRPFTTRDIAVAERVMEVPLRPAVLVHGRRCTLLRHTPTDVIFGDMTRPPEAPAAPAIQAEEFEFDDCLWSVPAEQLPPPQGACVDELDLYERYCRQTVNAALLGRDVCIAAHGAIFTGKNHSLFGAFAWDTGIMTSAGMVHHLAHRLFAGISGNPRITVTCAFMEVLHDGFYDLLANGGDGRPSHETRQLRLMPLSSSSAPQITRTLVRDASGVAEVVHAGMRLRASCVTRMGRCRRESPNLMQLQITREDSTGMMAPPTTTTINLIAMTAPVRRRYPTETVDRRPFPSCVPTFRQCMDCVLHNWQRAGSRCLTFPESALTRLLDRSLTDRKSLRIVVATVSPFEGLLEDTARTLREARSWTVGSL